MLFVSIEMLPPAHLPSLRYSLPPHLKSIDSRLVSAVSPDDSTVAPFAPSSLQLQEETGGGTGGGGGSVGQGEQHRTLLAASQGGRGGNRAAESDSPPSIPDSDVGARAHARTCTRIHTHTHTHARTHALFYFCCRYGWIWHGAIAAAWYLKLRRVRAFRK
jgi:hypothetical protein